RAEKYFKKALALDHGNSDAHQGMAKLRMEQGRLSEALAEIKLALNSSPGDAYLYVLEARILQLQMKLAEAERHARKTINRFPGCGEAYLALADILVDQKRYLETIEVVNTSLKHKLGMDVRQELLQKMARAYYGLGQNDRIDEVFEKVLEDEPDPAFRYKMEANFYVGQGELARGIPLYKKYLQENPDDLEQRHNLCAALFAAHDYRECINEARVFLKKNPGHLRVILMLVESLTQEGEFEEAEKHLSRAEDLGGDDLRNLLARANLERAKGNYKTAMDLYNEVLRRNPASENAHCDLGEIFLKQGNPLPAIEHFKHVLKTDPENVQAASGLALSYKKSGDEENFQDAYNRVLKLGERRIDLVPGDKEAYRALGLAHLAAGEVEKARSAFLKMGKSDSYGYIMIGNYLFDKGAYKDAMESYREALEINPSDEHCLLQLGNCLYHEKDYKGAIVVYHTLLRSHPKNAMGHYNLAKSFVMAGKEKQALSELKKAIKLASEFKDDAKDNPAFDRLRHQPEFQKIINH
ncbi:MAG: tetratricopeptide repeat protein, partial [Candidatus Eremiobacteraeota bacterium]|nr:tetratricopeptide repeat protein [Candidatus Eremiobacteraeota bacterium]